MFERLFGDSGSTDPRARLARIRQERSVLDSVTEEVARPSGQRSGPADRTKLVEYLDADSRRRAAHPEGRGAERQRAAAHRPPGGHPGHLRRARQADVRPAGAGLSGRPDPRHHVHAGPRVQRHDLSADRRARRASPDLAPPAGTGEDREGLAKINAYHVQLFAYLLEKLRATPDGDGTLLDHMMMMYGAGMADSNAHAPLDIPLLLAGGGAGQLKGGRHIRYPKGHAAGQSASDAARPVGRARGIGSATAPDGSTIGSCLWARRLFRHGARFIRETTMHVNVKGVAGGWIVALTSVVSLAAVNDTRLIDAVKDSNVKRVQALVRERIDVNATAGQTARPPCTGRCTGTI